MKVQVKKIDDCQRILEIEVQPEIMQQEFETVINRFLKNASLPGFRPGKVPRELILSRFGKDIESEVLRNTIPQSYTSALKETDLWPIGEPEISKLEWNPDKPLIFEAKVEVKPKIKLGQYKGLKGKKEMPVASDSEVDEEIKAIQERMATYNLISDRPLQNGDTAIIDLEIYVDGKIIAGGKTDNFSLETGKDLFGPGFDKELVGLKTGEKKDINFKLPADHPSAELQSKEAVFSVKLKEIREKKTPPIDDELAKRFKDCQNLNDLKEKIKHQLKQWKEAEAFKKMRVEIISRLLETAEFPLPLSLVKQRQNVLLGYTLKRLEGMGFSRDEIKKDEEKFNEEAYKKAAEEIKLALMLEAIAEKENIIISEEEAKEELKKLGQYSRRKDLDEEITDGFIEQLRHNKTLNFIISSAHIEEIVK